MTQMALDMRALARQEAYQGLGDALDVVAEHIEGATEQRREPV